MMLTALLPWYWRWIALVMIMVACAAFGAIKMLEHDNIERDKLRDEYAAFRANVSALAAVAIQNRDATITRFLAAKKEADHENADAHRDLDRVTADYIKLRDARPAGSRIVPAPASGTDSAASVRFDRAALDLALSEFDRGATGIIVEGDAALADLNTARRWAQRLQLSYELARPTVASR